MRMAGIGLIILFYFIFERVYLKDFYLCYVLLPRLELAILMIPVKTELRLLSDGIRSVRSYVH